jgi:hypothetical protein
MISRRRRPDRAAYPAPVPPELCELGGLLTVLGSNDLATASLHFGHCTACQREFVRRGGLLPVRQLTAPPDSHPVSVTPAAEAGPKPARMRSALRIRLPSGKASVVRRGTTK